MKCIADMTEGVPSEVHGNSAVVIRGIAYHSAMVEPGFVFVAVEGFKIPNEHYVGGAVNHGSVTPAVDTKKRVAIPNDSQLRLLGNRSADLLRQDRESPEEDAGFATALRRDAIRARLAAHGRRPAAGHARAALRGASIGKETCKTSRDFILGLGRAGVAVVAFLLKKGEIITGTNGKAKTVHRSGLMAHLMEDTPGRAATEGTAGAFTNLTQAHLFFYHPYHLLGKPLACSGLKTKLFSKTLSTATAVGNSDDDSDRGVPPRARARVISYGTRPEVELNSTNKPWSFTEVAYTRTPDAPWQTLHSAREWSSGMMVANPYHSLEDREVASQSARAGATSVFGCGGDRDRNKRPLMGETYWQFVSRMCVSGEYNHSLRRDATPNTVEVYDPAYGMWIAARTAPSCDNSAWAWFATTVNGKVYCVGSHLQWGSTPHSFGTVANTRMCRIETPTARGERYARRVNYGLEPELTMS